MTQSFAESIAKIAQGVKHFQTEAYPAKQSLFEALAKTQTPKVLFITCSDSRVSPALITQTDPGDMFVIQNAGNIVPPHGVNPDGIGASIEYAVAVLNVEHVIICGHSNCGAMKGLLHKETLTSLPSVQQWLAYADSARAILQANGHDLDNESSIDHCIQANIQVQLANLRTLPAVAAKLSQNKLSLHGWVYDIQSGKINVYQPEKQQFISFEQAYTGELAHT